MEKKVRRMEKEKNREGREGGEWRRLIMENGEGEEWRRRRMEKEENGEEGEENGEGGVERRKIRDERVETEYRIRNVEMENGKRRTKRSKTVEERGRKREQREARR